MKIKPNKIIWGIIALSFVGLLDATYLTVSHYSGAQLSCSLTTGCNTVTTSIYSQIFGIPVALLGLIFYFTVLFLSLLYFDLQKPDAPGIPASGMAKGKAILKIIAPLSGLAFLSSAYFMYVQFFVIKALCQYCILSALLSTTIFILSLVCLAAASRK
ncbi:vitamin K epoxide reductase family protein [Candidatus Peregrinibacteria bacterium]|nr:vitamin K epoxide reductase family protein [Candidatus Peregrinibacteria bacterium]